ncbi:SDR family NAD(P)-dependent oxidoreductase [Labrys monachus]
MGLAAMRLFRAQGDDVLLADIDAAAADAACAEPGRGAAQAFACDLADPDAPARAVEAAAARFGGIDTVFANAGILVSRPLGEWTVADWQRSLAVNLTAPFLLAQAAAPHLRRSAGASVIFTASTGALRGHAGMPAYHATKTGLVGLCRSLADELAPDGVRVNCLLPGWVDTPFNAPFWSFQADRAQAERDVVGRIPMRRQGTPEEVAATVLFLASKAAAYITGTTLVVDGGYCAI